MTSPATFAVAERTYTAETLIHVHAHAQVVLPVRGQLDLLVGDQRGAVARSQFAVVAPESEHICWAEGPTRCFVIDLANTRPDFWVGPTFRQVDERIGALGHLLRAELAAGGLDDPLVVETLGRYAVRTFTATGDGHARAGMGPGARLLARRVRAYLEAHFRDDCSLSDVAASVGASVAHAQRSFRAETGVSIVTYVQRLRLEAAEELLRSSDLSVGEIAAATGFGSSSYLARLFVRRYGVGPAQFRRLTGAHWSGSDANRA